MLRWFLTFLLLTGCQAILKAQFYSTGESPSSIKWNQIHTANFRLVFPRMLSEDAMMLARKLEQAYPLSLNDLPSGQLRKPYQVILHGASLRSNGFVTLAPSRMELIAAPPQDSYAQDWLTQLSLHESKHMIQLNALSHGFTGSMRIFAGEIAPGIVSSQIPAWFYEGDAVYNETILSATGRGRLPGFEMEIKAMLKEKPEIYSYNKAVGGSYKDFIPDHYRLGYQMVNYACNRYGKDFWPGALSYTARNPYFIWPFTFYLKDKAGSGKGRFYHQVMDSLKAVYSMEEVEPDTTILVAGSSGKVYTSYIRPKMDESVLYYFRSGLSDAGSLVMTEHTGKSKVLIRIGRPDGFDYDIKNKLLVWTESRNDPRWQKRDYSVVLLSDLATGKSKMLTKRSRFFSPDISPDLHRLAVVGIEEDNAQYLTILDIQTGEELFQYAAGSKELQSPEWITDSEIAYISVTESGKQLEKINLQTGSISVIIPDTYTDISEPVHFRNYILFRCSVNGTDNIYAVNIQNNNEIYRLTDVKYGAYYPSVSSDSSRVLFSNYTADGFEIQAFLADKITSHKIIQNVAFGSAAHSRTFSDTAKINFTQTPYRKYLHLFRFHSWLPFYFDLTDFRDDPAKIDINPGFMLFSQNLLGSVNLSLGYSYRDGYHYFSPVLSWRQWYPVIEFSMEAGGPPVSIAGSEIPQKARPYFEYHVKTYIPFVFNYRNYLSFLQPRIEYQHLSLWFSKNNSPERGIGFLHMKMLWSNYQRMAVRDLFPKWGQSVTLGYTISPEEKDQFRNMVSVQSSFYFPGIFPHHHVNIRAEYQRQNTGLFFIPVNRVDFPKGFQNTVSREMTSLKISYSLPVAYPDLSAGAFFYLKRIRNSFFYDFSYGTDILQNNIFDRYYTGQYRSFGTEIMTDLYVFRFIFPFSAGVRIGYKPDDAELYTELILNINTGIY